METLPWDDWGRMTQAYVGRTGQDYDALLAAGQPRAPTTAQTWQRRTAVATLRVLADLVG